MSSFIGFVKGKNAGAYGFLGLGGDFDKIAALRGYHRGGTTDIQLETYFIVCFFMIG